MLLNVSDQVQWHDIPRSQKLQGKEDYKTWIQNWSTAFPDAKLEILNAFTSGDSVVVEFTAKGTHKGALSSPGMQIPPTNRPLEMSFCDVIQLRDGKIVSARTYYDLATIARQLGVESKLSRPAAA